MRAISIKAEYARDWEWLLKRGMVETNGNSARYIARVLADHKLDGDFKHFRNEKTKRSILILGRTVKRMKKYPGWNRIRFCPVF